MPSTEIPWNEEPLHALNALKETRSKLIKNPKKDSWKEDTKLDGLVKHASDELRTAK